jgi:hypothetical protein
MASTGNDVELSVRNACRQDAGVDGWHDEVGSTGDDQRRAVLAMPE